MVEGGVSPQLSVTLSFRLPGFEADAIRQAARTSGVTLSEWIRMACADAADSEGGQGRRHRVDAELDRGETQLDAIRRRLDAVRRYNRRMVRARPSSGDPSRVTHGSDP